MRGMNLELKPVDGGGVSLIFNGSVVMIYKIPSPDKMLKDIKIHMKATGQKTSPEFEDLIAYNVNQVYIKYVPLQNEEKARKGKTSITCPCCGGEAKAKGMNFRCENCKNEFDVDGNYTHIPWKEEPTEKELIKCTTHEAFNEILSFWQDHVVYSDPRSHVIDTLFTILTYHQHRFNTIGYRAYEASGNEKGKTTAACEVHSALNYRAVFTSRPTPAFILKLLEDGGCIILDQAEDAFYKKYEKTDIYNIWTSGYKKGISTGKLSAADKQSYDDKSTFGFKVTNMQEGGKTDNPLNSRTLREQMQKGVPKIKRLDLSVDRSKKIRFMMHYLKKELDSKCKTIDTNLDGRAGEIFDPLLSIVKLYNLSPEIEEIVYVRALEFIDEKKEEADDTLPAIVVEGISATIRQNPLFGDGKTSAKDVTDWILTNYEDRFNKLTNRKVGDIFNKMGLKKEEKRQNDRFVFDLKRIDNMEAFEKSRLQYKPTGIKAKVQELEDEFKSMGADKINLDGTDYQRYYKLNKFKELAASIHKEAISTDVPINFYEDDVEQPPENPNEVPIIEVDEEQPEDPTVDQIDLTVIEEFNPDNSLLQV